MRTDVSRGAAQHHFPAHEDLFTGAVEHVAEERSAAMRAVPGQDRAAGVAALVDPRDEPWRSGRQWSTAAPRCRALRPVPRAAVAAALLCRAVVASLSFRRARQHAGPSAGSRTPCPVTAPAARHAVPYSVSPCRGARPGRRPARHAGTAAAPRRPGIRPHAR